VVPCIRLSVSVIASLMLNALRNFYDSSMLNPEQSLDIYFFSSF
jgi:hypothetical protein